MTHPRRAARDPLSNAVRPGEAGTKAFWVGGFLADTPAW